jgi:vacuolar iron transporter family protein
MEIEMPTLETHRMSRIGWLRAAVLGANDGIVSIASLVIGVAAAETSRADTIVAGWPGSWPAPSRWPQVSTCRSVHNPTRSAPKIERERCELEAMPVAEEEELTQIYVGRGLDETLARTVSRQLMASGALRAHTRDELGIQEASRARPLQAAAASALAFAAGATLPLILAYSAPAAGLNVTVAGGSLVALTTLGGLAAYAGGAPVFRGAVRVAIWGAVAMLITGWIGYLSGRIV